MAARSLFTSVAAALAADGEPDAAGLPGDVQAASMTQSGPTRANRDQRAIRSTPPGNRHGLNLTFARSAAVLTSIRLAYGCPTVFKT